MNLYNLHTQKYKLVANINAMVLVPVVAFDMVKNVDPTELSSTEDLWAQDPKTALGYALYLRKINRNNRRWPPGEPAIATDPKSSFVYAVEVTGQRFPLGEPKIMQMPSMAALYAGIRIKGPWPEAEPIIATDSAAAQYYAMRVIKEPFPLGEPAIATDHEDAMLYVYAFPSRVSAITRLQNNK